MKRRIVVLTMLCILLTSCAPTYAEESSTVSEDQSVISEQSQDDSVLDDMTFPDRYHEVLLDQYKGKKAEQLEAEFDYSVCGISEFVTAQTALSVFFPYAGTVYRFDKLTRKAVVACGDPLCEHKDCAFSMPFFIAADKTNIYIAGHTVSAGGHGISLRISDLDGMNQKTLYEAPFGEFMLLTVCAGKFYCANTTLDENGMQRKVLDSVDPDGVFERIVPEQTFFNIITAGDRLFLYHESGISVLNGKELERVYEGPVTSLRSEAGCIYFTDDNEKTLRIEPDTLTAESVSQLPQGVYYRGYFYICTAEDGKNTISRIRHESTENETVFDFTGAEIQGIQQLDGNYVFTMYSDEYDRKKADELSKRSGAPVEPKTHFAIFDMNTGKRYILIPDYD